MMSSNGNQINVSNSEHRTIKKLSENENSMFRSNDMDEDSVVNSEESKLKKSCEMERAVKY